MALTNLTGIPGQIAQVALDSAPLAAAFAAYSIADDKRSSTAVKALVAVAAGIVANFAKGYVEKNVVSISGLTLERVGALPMPHMRTRTNQRRGYGALTLEQLSGCVGCY